MERNENTMASSANPLPTDMTQENGENSFVSIFEVYWQAIKSNLIPIILILVVSLIAGLVITILTTPKYSAESRIEINRNQDNVTNVEGLQTEEIGQNLEFYQTQYALLEARSLAQRVVRSLNLHADDKFFEQYGIDTETIGGVLQEGTSNRSNGRNERLKIATNVMLDGVEISPIRSSSLVDVSFTSPDPEFSAQVANEWVEQFIQSNLDRRFASTSDARKFLEERLGQLRERLEESERRLVGYASDKAIVTLSSSQNQSGKTVTERTMVAADLESLNAALADATAARIEAGSQVQRGGSIRAEFDNAALNGMRQKRAEVEAERANLLTQFEPGYPTVMALTSERKALDKSILDEERRVRSGSSTRYRDALDHERNLALKVDQLKQRFVRQRSDTIQYNIYQREVDTNRELYDGLLQRYKEIGVAGVGNNNISIVDRARTPDDQSSPILPLNLALALVAGLIISAGYVYVSEQIDQSLKDPYDVTKILGLSLLGSVPNIKRDNILESLKDKKSEATEAYFSIGTSLTFLTEHGAPKSCLITSSWPNEGKSTTAFALGQTLANTGKKVLLIDADMRNPSVHLFFDLPNERGLSNYLAGEDDINSLILSPDGSSLSIMSAGMTPPNAGELLSGDRVLRLVQKLSAEYDHIIFDAPPVLGLADVPLLTKSVDGVIYTIEANKLKIRTIQSALRRVVATNAHVFGAIVTKLDDRNSSYGYGYGYGYGYQYSSDKDPDDNAA